MVETIISYLNAKLEGTGYFHSLYCLVEKKKEPREEGDFVYPATYVGGGDLELVEFDSVGFAYFRKNGDFGQSVVANDLGQKQLYSIDLPFRLVAMVRRQDVVTDDSYSPDRLARELASVLTFRNGDLRTFLQASRVTVTSGSWTTNPEQIWTDETEGTGRIEPDYSRAFIAMDVTVNVLADEGCIHSACTDDPDILHLFDFCQAGTVARLTDEQVTCLEAALCEPCADATVTINTAPFGTAPSGGGLDVPVVNGGANQVGSIVAGEVVIANNATFINGTQVTDQEAEVDANIFVTLNGTQSGTWNAGIQTWEVTSPPCADATFSIDGTQVDTIASGADLDVSVELNGSPVTPTYNSGTKVIGVTGGVSGSIAVAVSNATPTFGQSITITATPTGFTPTSYLFFAFDGSSVELIAEQAGAVVNWSVALLGAFDIYALGTDGAIETYGTVSATSTGDPDASAFIIAAGITDSTEKSAVTTLTLALKAASLYAKFIAVYPLVGGTANSHKYNLIDPQDTDLAHRLTFSGGWTHTSNGARGNASNTFANTHIIPNALLTSGSNSVGFYSRSNVSENKYDFGCSTDAGASTNPFGVISWYNSGSAAYYMSGNYNLSAVVGSSLGLTHGFGNSGTWRLYRNGAQIGSTASSAIALPNFSLYLGGNNGGGTLSLVSSREYAFAFVANQQMTPTDAVNLYAIIQAYQTTLNRQV